LTYILRKHHAGAQEQHRQHRCYTSCLHLNYTSVFWFWFGIATLYARWRIGLTYTLTALLSKWDADITAQLSAECRHKNCADYLSKQSIELAGFMLLRATTGKIA
jgi:hypothetical protein